MAPKICPECQSTELEHDTLRNDLCCKRCGCVVEENNIVSEISFAENSAGAAMVQGSFIAADQTRAHGSGDFRRQGSVDSREQTLANGKRRINNLAVAMSLPEYIAEAANRLFQLAVAQDFVQGRKSQYVIAACLYVACRKQESTHMLIDFADILQVSVFAIGATYLKLVQTLGIKNIPLIDPSIYIQRFASKLGFGTETNKVMNDAVRLVQRMGKDWLHQGRRPAGVAGACVLVAARMNNFCRTKAEVVYVAKVAEDTIQRRLDEFRSTAAGSLTVQAFRGTNIESEADPPSFTKHRQRELELAKSQHNVSVNEKEPKPLSALAQVVSQTSQRAALRAERLRSTDTNDAEAMARLAKEDEQDEAEIAEELDETLNDTQFQSVTRSAEEELRKNNGTANSGNVLSSSALDSEDLADVDDAEIESVIMNPEEVEMKQRIWTHINRSFLLEQERKRLKEEFESGNGISKAPKRKRKARAKRSALDVPASPAESGKRMLQQRVSKKLNYAAINGLFNKQPDSISRKETRA
ncbi:hypothetical protein CANCADRAFT_30706 [Tortispora caseinolytica NRRL Y-17796]|uniref:B-related factor 1 n=1 Tax=Tortispora caseinolytica NRRL Y-17796 TaxID=767744 RepID=A0A1E4TLF8_9ASCO|nr:hypothetical protein CANCADRAFT_30706 [Tortispora caseinolytica NRRL Y-17796]